MQERVQTEPPVDVRATRASPARLAVLGLLLESPAHPYDVALRFSERMGQTWGIHRAQVYQAVYGLERDGLVERVDETDGEDPRTIFRPTGRGRDVFETWLNSDAGGPLPVRDGLLIRLAFARPENVANLRNIVARREHAVVGRLWEYGEASEEFDEEAAEQGAWRGGLELIVDRTVAVLQTEVRWLHKVRDKLEALESVHKDAQDDDSATT